MPPWQPAKQMKTKGCMNENVKFMKRNLCAKQHSAKVFAGKLLMVVTLSCLASVMNAQTFSGKASFYASAFHGKISASGKVYDMYKYTCAHKKLPFGTKLKVTNLKNGKTVTVEVTDRGPYVKGRVIDLSKAAAMDLDMVQAGIANVEIEVVKDEPEQPRAQLILSEPELLKEFELEVPKTNVTAEWARTLR